MSVRNEMEMEEEAKEKERKDEKKIREREKEREKKKKRVARDRNGASLALPEKSLLPRPQMGSTTTERPDVLEC